VVNPKDKFALFGSFGRISLDSIRFRYYNCLKSGLIGLNRFGQFFWLGYLGRMGIEEIEDVHQVKEE